MIDQQFGLGAIPSPPDLNDYKLALDTAAPLPRRWAIGKDNVPRVSMAPHLNQGNTPMCGGYSGATLKRQQEKADQHGVLDLDAAWLYRHSRLRAGLAPSTEGTTARAVLATLLHEGIPIRDRDGTAMAQRIKSYAAIPFNAGSIKRALIQYQGPVLIGSAWPGNWQTRSSWHPWKGIAPAPSAVIGGHLWCLIAYDDGIADGSFLCFNTWGDDWASNGNLWIPYRYLIPLVHDAWKALDA